MRESTAHTIKEQLRAGRPSIGTWLTLNTALGAEWMAYQGFDWLAVEQERGLAEPLLPAHLLQAIGTTNVMPAIRARCSEPQTMGRAVAAGAGGVFFAAIETREAAERCVGGRARALAGVRGSGARTGWGDSRAYERLPAGPDPLIVVMIETALGLRNMEEIVGVPGIDACMVRPSELCADLGWEPGPERPDARLEAAIGEVYAACRRHDVAPGLHVPTAQDAIRRIDEGWQLIAVASDGDFMTRAAASAAATIRSRLRLRPAG
jgi:2-keto-3-deoxy-L-rhamnonate aldolase RhmA